MIHRFMVSNRTRHARRRGLIAALLAIPFATGACDDGAGPDGDPSDLDVYVFVEMDDSAGLGAGDLPIRATVTVASQVGDLVLVDTTGADGVVRFPQLPAGAYSVSHVVTAAPAGAELQGNASQTVVTPFGGDTVVDARFIYRLDQGGVEGVVYRDDDGSDDYGVGLDSTYAGFAVLIWAGADTLGAPAAADTTGADGRFDLGQLEGGDYTLLVRPRVGTAIVGGNPRPVTVTAGSVAFLEIEIVGDPTGPVITIQDARARSAGDTVKVRGVVTARQGVFRHDSFYMQDATGGVFVFGVDSALALARGDSVQVRGVRSSTRQEVMIHSTSTVRLGTGTLPDPVTLTTSDLNAGLFQGRLGTLVATVDSVRGGTAFNVYVRDAVDRARIYVDAGTGIPQTRFPVDSTRTITGIVSVYDQDGDGTIEMFDYRLLPRDTADVR